MFAIVFVEAVITLSTRQFRQRCSSSGSYPYSPMYPLTLKSNP